MPRDPASFVPQTFTSPVFVPGMDKRVRGGGNFLFPFLTPIPGVSSTVQVSGLPSGLYDLLVCGSGSGYNPGNSRNGTAGSVSIISRITLSPEDVLAFTNLNQSGTQWAQLSVKGRTVLAGFAGGTVSGGDVNLSGQGSSDAPSYKALSGQTLRGTGSAGTGDQSSGGTQVYSYPGPGSLIIYRAD